MYDDTIAAIATPIGEGGLATIRLSGPQAIEIADRVFKPIGKSSSKPSQASSHTIHYGYIVRAGKVVDEVMLAVMNKPRTFTCEDVIEIYCHGGILSTKLVLDTVLDQGARSAAPGEFTKRAFLNGRIDLTQAEAVADLISAQTELALESANAQLAGKLSQRINQLRDELVHTLSHIEAHIDFPDEDIAPDSAREINERMERGVKMMEELLQTAKEGQVLRRGARVAIVGPPNTGKSSLLNCLLGHDRAIVSTIAGTTRDTIAETANIRGLPIVFFDTAGLRDTSDVIEKEGVRRSRQALQSAELILLMFDSAMPLSPIELGYLKESESKPRIIVCNKIDLPRSLRLPEELKAPVVQVSCLNGRGLEALKDTIKKMIWSGQIQSNAVEATINARHQEALQRAKDSLNKSIATLRQSLAIELVALDLRIAVDAIGEIVGKTTTEDLLDKIFAEFCIGK
jgi:tRNA modification GTPase